MEKSQAIVMRLLRLQQLSEGADGGLGAPAILSPVLWNLSLARDFQPNDFAHFSAPSSPFSVSSEFESANPEDIRTGLRATIVKQMHDDTPAALRRALHHSLEY